MKSRSAIRSNKYIKSHFNNILIFALIGFCYTDFIIVFCSIRFAELHKDTFLYYTKALKQLFTDLLINATRWSKMSKIFNLSVDLRET